MSCSNLKNNTNDEKLEKLGLIEIRSNETYISKLIETNIKNAFDVYKTKNSRERKYIIIIDVNDTIESSLLANSIRKIEMSINYKIVEKNSNIVLVSDSFSRNSLVGPINSLFSRDQSELNARKRLGISISNDMIIRLIEWASFDLEA
tara:strand:+ start:260 stop:703 length:444 start_codon:yes stop_codon:yes gene_type:complete